MLYVLYLRRGEPISLNLKMGDCGPNEYDIKNHFKIVRAFSDEPPLSKMDEYLEMIFAAMQAEVWSPNGEKRELIKELGLLHTSMSVGDMVYDDRHHMLWRVKGVGFEKVEVPDLATGEQIAGRKLHELIPIEGMLFKKIETAVLVSAPPTSLESWLSQKDSDWIN